MATLPSNCIPGKSTTPEDFSRVGCPRREAIGWYLTNRRLRVHETAQAIFTAIIQLADLALLVGAGDDKIDPDIVTKAVQEWRWPPAEAAGCLCPGAIADGDGPGDSRRETTQENEETEADGPQADETPVWPPQRTVHRPASSVPPASANARRKLDACGTSHLPYTTVLLSLIRRMTWKTGPGCGPPSGGWSCAGGNPCRVLNRCRVYLNGPSLERLLPKSDLAEAVGWRLGTLMGTQRFFVTTDRKATRTYVNGTAITYCRAVRRKNPGVRLADATAAVDGTFRRSRVCRANGRASSPPRCHLPKMPVA